MILTFDPAAIRRFWLAEYVPEMLAGRGRRYPAIVGGEVTPVPIPLDCEDGFIEAFYGRPEAFLDPEVRRSQSAWAFGETRRRLERLRADLESGAWDARHGHLRTQPSSTARCGSSWSAESAGHGVGQRGGVHAGGRAATAARPLPA